MNASSRDAASLNGASKGAPSDLEGRRLRVARLGWWVVAGISASFLISGLREQYSGLSLFFFTTNPPPPEVVREGLDKLGLSPTLHAGYAQALYLFRAAAFYLVAGMLFWRKPADRMALLVAYFLVALPTGDTDPVVLHAMFTHHPIRATAGILMDTVAFILLLWLFLLFPEGHFRPTWTRVVALIWALVGVGTLFLPGSPLDLGSWPLLLSDLFIPACAIVAIYAQVWRYHRISGAVERQQAKWFALGISVVLIEFPISNALTPYHPLNWPAKSPAQVVLLDLLLFTIHTLVFLAVPLTLGVAILRYRLWDIDVLINRALVYGSLTITLAAIYVGSVALLEAAVRAFTGQSSNLAIAASTLTIAALFRPLRGRMQSTIDRRFYRHKYDASRTLARFGATLRHETDLGRIQADLLAAVDETMQPVHASLWLLPPRKRVV